MRLSEPADGDGGISPRLSGYEAVLCFVMEVGGGDNEQVRHLVGRDGVQVVVVDGLPVGNLQLGFGGVEGYHHAFLLVGSQTCDIGCVA